MASGAGRQHAVATECWETFEVVKRCRWSAPTDRRHSLESARESYEPPSRSRLFASITAREVVGRHRRYIYGARGPSQREGTPVRESVTVYTISRLMPRRHMSFEAELYVAMKMRNSTRSRCSGRV